jgi:hypothetical protein
MSSIVISGDTSGAITLAAPAVSGTNTATLPAATGTVMVSGNMPAFSAYLNGGNQGITTTTWTKVTLNAKEFDTANCFDSTTNYRFTPNVAGYYQINGAIFYSGNAYYSEARIAIYKNGSQLKQTVLGTNGTLINISSGIISSLIFMNGSTDYVELYAYEVNAVSPTCVSGATNTYFSGFLARAS